MWMWRRLLLFALVMMAMLSSVALLHDGEVNHTRWYTWYVATQRNLTTRLAHVSDPPPIPPHRAGLAFPRIVDPIIIVVQ
jgi:hypothetical protein